MPECKNCKSEHVVKSGKVRGKQRNKCKECGSILSGYAEEAPNNATVQRRFTRSASIFEKLSVFLPKLQHISPYFRSFQIIRELLYS
jgi:hypothetical protein